MEDTLTRYWREMRTGQASPCGGNYVYCTVVAHECRRFVHFGLHRADWGAGPLTLCQANLLLVGYTFRFVVGALLLLLLLLLCFCVV